MTQDGNLTDEQLKAQFIATKGITKCPPAINIGVTGLADELDGVIGLDTRCLFDSPNPPKKRGRKKGNKKRGRFFREV